MGLRHVLAVVDQSPTGIHAAWRAARVAWSQGATLHLLTLLDLPSRHPSARHGATAPPVRARADLEHLAGHIAAAVGLRPQVSVGLGEGAPALLLRLARDAGLVVVPGTVAPSGYRGLAARIVREAGVPVFLVRRPSGAVHRGALVVAQPRDAALAPLLRAALWFCRADAVLACQVLDPAVERDLQAADMPLPAIQAWLETAANRATLALRAQLAQAGMAAAGARVLRGQALPRLLAEQQRSGATLLVVHKPRRSWWADLLRPVLGQRLADGVDCDVLWMPLPAASAQAARQRLGLLQTGAPQDG